MDFTQVTSADHAAAIFNQLVRPGTDVYRVDDFGRLHHDQTRSAAWVMPSGSAVVKTVGAGTYLLSRIWTRDVLNDFAEKYAPEGFELITAE